jgi:hypothetical protein
MDVNTLAGLMILSVGLMIAVYVWLRYREKNVEEQI